MRRGRLIGHALARAAAVAVLGGLLVGLPACGFHLRGAGGLPEAFSSTQVTGIAPRSNLALALAQGLEANGAKVVDDAENAHAVLRIEKVSYSNRILSVDTSARVLEYELAVTVAFSAHARDGSFELPTQRITSTRSLSYDPANQLGKTREEERLREAMERELVPVILERLRAAGG